MAGLAARSASRLTDNFPMDPHAKPTAMEEPQGRELMEGLDLQFGDWVGEDPTEALELELCAHKHHHSHSSPASGDEKEPCE